MNKYVLLLVFLFTLTTASSACSMQCCKGKTECCCEKKSQHNQAAVPFHFKGAIDVGACACDENTPVPTSEENVVSVRSAPSSKYNDALCTIFQSIDQYHNASVVLKTHPSFESPPGGKNLFVPLRI